MKQVSLSKVIRTPALLPGCADVHGTVLVRVGDRGQKGARPRNEKGFSAVSRHAGLVFNRLLKPNTDLAIDFHTGTTGLDVSAFHDDN